MSTNPHPHAQLSAYLDDALAPSERSAVEGHLVSCADCRARLSELRSTVSLIRALPDLAPSRRLVPRVAGPPAWFAPLRTLSTLASGVSVFLFIASALLANINTLATSTSAAAPAAGAANATSAERGTSAPSASSAALSGRTGDTAPKTAVSPTPALPAAQFTTSSSAAQDAAARGDQSTARDASKPAGPPLGPSPWLWLGLAVVTGVLAIALQRRLRSA